MPNTLRLKSSLSHSEIDTLTTYLYTYARQLNVPFLYDLDSAKKIVRYVVDKEVGSFARAGGFPTNLSNGVFAGILQTGVDVLIEGNAATKDTSYKRLSPVMWAVFPQGIHAMYTKRNRTKALEFHRSLVTFPRNVAGTATDSLVSIARLLDMANRAYAQFNNYLHRAPSQIDIYMYHMFGWPKMDAWLRVKSGNPRKGDMKLVESMPIDLSRQSNEVQRLVGPLLT